MLNRQKSIYIQFAVMLLLAIILAAGCQQQDEKTGPLTKSDLIGTKWQLEEIKFGRVENEDFEYVEHTVDTDTVVTLSFDDTFLGGNSFCGTYRIGWHMDVEADRLTTEGAMAQTTVGCPDHNDQIMLEQAFIEIMGKIIFAELDGGRLVINGGRAGQVFFAPTN